MKTRAAIILSCGWLASIVLCFWLMNRLPTAPPATPSTATTEKPTAAPPNPLPSLPSAVALDSPRIDHHLVHASHAREGEPKTPSVTIEYVEDKGIRWMAPFDKNTIRLQSKNYKIKFKAENAPAETVKIFRNKKSDSTANLSANEYQDTIDADKKIKIEFKSSGDIKGVKDADFAKVLAAITLVAPETDTTSVILGVSNGSYVTDTLPSMTPKKLYDGYLRLRVYSDAEPKQFEFFKAEKKQDQGEFKSISLLTPVLVKPEIKSETKTYEFTLDLGDATTDEQARQLLVRLRGNKDAHVYLGPEVAFVNKQNIELGSDPRLDTPAITHVESSPVTGPLLFNKAQLTLKGTAPNVPDAQILLFAGEDLEPVKVIDKIETWQSGVLVDTKIKDSGKIRFYARLARGAKVSPLKSKEVEVSVNTLGPRVADWQPRNFGTAPGAIKLTVNFKKENFLKEDLAKQANNYTLRSVRNPTITFTPNSADFLSAINAVVLDFTSKNILADSYQLEIIGLKDEFSSVIEGDKGSSVVVLKMDSTSSGTAVANFGTGLEPSPIPSQTRGLSSGNPAKFVEYPPFAQPAEPKSKQFRTGFNPGDKVETRVVRLYYYRDAHRVAQILNRDARSYNIVAVQQRQRLAEQARDQANQYTDERQASERAAVVAAGQTRELEAKIAGGNQQLSSMLNSMQQSVARKAELENRLREKDAQILATQQQQAQAPNDAKLKNLADQLAFERKNLEIDLAKSDADAKAFTSAAQDATTMLQNLQADQQTKRAAEVQANEKALQIAAKEERTRAEQFRREVAAALEDPDTAALGVPESMDPVRQVTISVIGEAVLQMRGPINGINILRQMVHQIDSPVGQVKVAIHTVQVNGEHGERMEPVIGRIQDYIDHSRFLTYQSAQMLRRAVVHVAGQRAEEAALACRNGTQQARDERYLYSFFGKDFIDELRDMKSEFLHTGNKLLSLHSMDTTSLASALTVLALAKNSTRREILEVFKSLLVNDLPASEQNYYEAGGFRKHSHLFPFQFLSQNARFESFLGFFRDDFRQDDTMNPAQREFVRLAQILKSQLITEMELKQRVTERSLIEDRMGSYDKELEDLTSKEAKLRDEFDGLFSEYSETTNRLQKTVTIILKELQVFNEELSIDRANSQLLSDLAAFQKKGPVQLQSSVNGKPAPIKLQATPTTRRTRSVSPMKTPDDNHGKPANAQVDSKVDEDDTLLKSDVSNAEALPMLISQLDKLHRAIDAINLSAPYDRMFKDADGIWKRMLQDNSKGFISAKDLKKLRELYSPILSHVVREAFEIERNVARLNALLVHRDMKTAEAFQTWIEVRNAIIDNHKDGSDLRTKAKEIAKETDDGFRKLLENTGRLVQTKRQLEERRRPLDYKKLLGMLIQEAQDKYVELLEGVRSHTANIDEYVKRISTALDDDFNTQFYNPAFREVRNASRSWDVTLGQVETTSILANNRMFAKVEPQATMEFDLPKRKIAITEGLQGAKAAVDTYGALLQDPSFLTMFKMYSGQPTSTLANGQGGGLSAVRNVLPGLGRLPDQKAMSQVAPTSLSYGTPLDALVPEPAIYKFETGTGYEIRPVIQPDGQSVVFGFDYLYTTNIREPVRPDEKHLGRVKRHYINTNVHLSNYELREISTYRVALRASRTGKGVPMLQDIPGLGVLFRPLPSSESALQQNIVLGQATIFPTLFDLMGLRWAAVVSDLDPLALANAEFVVRNRRKALMHHVYDASASQVDQFLQIPTGQRRTDLYRPQETIPYRHPNNYTGPGMNLRDSPLQEGYELAPLYPMGKFGASNSQIIAPGQSSMIEGYPGQLVPGHEMQAYPIAPPESGDRIAPPPGMRGYETPTPTGSGYVLPGPSKVPPSILNPILLPSPNSTVPQQHSMQHAPQTRFTQPPPQQPLQYPAPQPAPTPIFRPVAPPSAGNGRGIEQGVVQPIVVPQQRFTPVQPPAGTPILFPNR